MDSNNNLLALSSDEINKIDEFRKAKQTAVLVIMFSDIVNSTSATEKLGEQSYSKLRHVHDELFIQIMARDNAGRIIKEIGDSFLCVFSEPSTAVQRAIEFQNAIYSNSANLTLDDYTLKVKIGIHLGQVALENNITLDIFGRHVNRAARIQSIANGGQILTSQAIWENAIGWIKNQGDNNIKSIYYGKATVKGVSEKVDIYCFYDLKTGKPSSPEYFKKKKLRIGLILIASIVLMMVASFYILEKLNKLKQKADLGVMSQTKKTYFVQFDFSKLIGQIKLDKSYNLLDTVLIQKQLLSQLIYVLNPNVVLTDEDLQNQFSKAGTFYVHHKDTSSNYTFFRDTLNFSGTLFINAMKPSESNKDSVLMEMKLTMFQNDNSTNTAERRISFSLSRIDEPFRNSILEMILATTEDILKFQGCVINSNDSIVYFQLSEGATLRVGASILFMREYKGIEGLHKRLEDLEKRIDFFKNDPKDSILLFELSQEYAQIENDISRSDTNRSFATSQGIDMNGQVLELYDSTGKANWKIMRGYPYDKPSKGDLIRLAN